MRNARTNATAVSAEDATEATPLHVVAINGHMEAAKTLVQLSADTKAKDAHGATSYQPTEAFRQGGLK